MIRGIIRGAAMVALLGTLAVTTACSSIQVADGGKMSGGKNLFMGKIDVGSNATVGGELSTNNGSIRVGDEAVVKNLRTKRGNIGIGRGTTVEGGLTTGLGDIVLGENVNLTGGAVSENGTITVNDGCKIGGSLRATSHISVTNSEIAQNVYSSQGNIDLVGTKVEGGVNLERSTNVIADGGQTLTLGKGTVVEGPIKVSSNVRVRIHSSAKAKGGVTGVDPESFD